MKSTKNSDAVAGYWATLIPLEAYHSAQHLWENSELYDHRSKCGLYVSPQFIKPDVSARKCSKCMKAEEKSNKQKSE